MITGLRAPSLAVFGTAALITCVQSTELAQQSASNLSTTRSALASNNSSPLRPRVRGKQSDRFSNILLTTQHGKRVRFYDDLIKGKVVLINLMYTTCPKICPVNSARLARIHELLKPWVGRDITMLSLSIDSDVDTPERLKRYWEVFGSKSGWLFLTGNYDEIDRLRRQLGVYDLDPVIDADKTQHSGIITIGNDRTDRWTALPILMHAQQLAATILRQTYDGEFGAAGHARKQAGNKPLPGRGIVRGINADNRTVLIEHEDIPGFMQAMTMRFNVADTAMLENISRGQNVVFRIKHSKGEFQIVTIKPQPN